MIFLFLRLQDARVFFLRLISQASMLLTLNITHMCSLHASESVLGGSLAITTFLHLVLEITITRPKFTFISNIDFPFFFFQLVAPSVSNRNWRGILIALLVIIIVLALIITSVVSGPLHPKFISAFIKPFVQLFLFVILHLPLQVFGKSHQAMGFLLEKWKNCFGKYLKGSERLKSYGNGGWTFRKQNTKWL